MDQPPDLSAQLANPHDEIAPLDEFGIWRGRRVTYWTGRWEHLAPMLPQFECTPFRASGDGAANRHLNMVVRRPALRLEKPVPVGVVSPSYALAQHGEVAAKCFEGLRRAGVEPRDLRCDLGLSDLGEWMNLRIYLPDSYDRRPDPTETKPLTVRLECYNSVDGSSRLVLLLGWFRFICTNGLVIGETKVELRDIHNHRLDLDRIPDHITWDLGLVEADHDRLRKWRETTVDVGRFAPWVDAAVAKRWQKKAACRVFHICTSGHDVQLVPPFKPVPPSEKPVRRVLRVPGSPETAANLYDVSQALSWVASRRNRVPERPQWQAAIPALIRKLDPDSDP